MRAAHFLRDLGAKGAILLTHVPGSTMIADMLTKALPRPVFLALLRLVTEYARDGVAVPEADAGTRSVASPVVGKPGGAVAPPSPSGGE